jgi:hypothetical protein
VRRGIEPSLPLASALIDLSESAVVAGETDEANAAIDEALPILRQLIDSGRPEAAAHYASGQAVRGNLLEKQERWDDAASAYFLGATVYRSVPAAITSWAFDVFKQLSHGFVRAATKAGTSRREIDRCLGMLGALAIDPESAPDVLKHHSAWVEAHNNSRSKEAALHYAGLLQALDAAPEDESLDPLRHSVRNTVRRLGSPSIYSPEPTLRRDEKSEKV